MNSILKIIQKIEFYYCLIIKGIVKKYKKNVNVETSKMLLVN